MFGMKRKSKPEPFVGPYRMIEETADFAYFEAQPGNPFTLKDLQSLKDAGFKFVHLDVRMAGSEMYSWMICEKIK